LIAHAVDLASLVGRVLDLLEGEAKQRSIRVERNLALVSQVAGDEGRLRQVVMNLSNNALEAVMRL
jgi:signal transduction histidine kinase